MIALRCKWVTVSYENSNNARVYVHQRWPNVSISTELLWKQGEAERLIVCLEPREALFKLVSFILFLPLPFIIMLLSYYNIPLAFLLCYFPFLKCQIFFTLCLCMCVCVCRWENNPLVLIFSFTIWAPGIELRALGPAPSAFILWGI